MSNLLTGQVQEFCLVPSYTKVLQKLERSQKKQQQFMNYDSELVPINKNGILDSVQNIITTIGVLFKFN